jgi:hypothetical protein
MPKKIWMPLTFVGSMFLPGIGPVIRTGLAKAFTSAGAALGGKAGAATAAAKTTAAAAAGTTAASSAPAWLTPTAVLGTAQAVSSAVGASAARAAAREQAAAADRAAQAQLQAQRESLEYAKQVEAQRRADWEAREARLAPYRQLGQWGAAAVAHFLGLPEPPQVPITPAGSGQAAAPAATTAVPSAPKPVADWRSVILQPTTPRTPLPEPIAPEPPVGLTPPLGQRAPLPETWYGIVPPYQRPDLLVPWTLPQV